MTTETATETAPTKEEAAAIRAWAEALRAAEKTISQAYHSLESIQGSVLREVKLDSPARPGHVDIRLVNLILEIAKHRGEAELAAEKIL
ncbi:MAG: hypothetical protein GY772_26370 [bacterium]|nr:hypothetical protein [bacterium]